MRNRPVLSHIIISLCVLGIVLAICNLTFAHSLIIDIVMCCVSVVIIVLVIIDIFRHRR